VNVINDDTPERVKKVANMEQLSATFPSTKSNDMIENLIGLNPLRP